MQVKWESQNWLVLFPFPTDTNIYFFLCTWFCLSAFGYPTILTLTAENIPFKDCFLLIHSLQFLVWFVCSFYVQSLDEVPSSNLENNRDVDNTERSDYESTSQLTVPQILSAEVASHGYADYLLSFLYSKLCSLFLLVVYSTDLWNVFPPVKSFSFFHRKECLGTWSTHWIWW